MFVRSLLVAMVLVGCCYGTSLPSTCGDIPICTAVFGTDAISQISECYDAETQTSCCATCKSLIGALGNTDPDCPWGNEGVTVFVDNQWMACGDLQQDATSCSKCAKGELFQRNCCQTCHERCPQ